MMEKKITPYKDSELNKKAQVEQMFDNISGGYDGLNRVISLGADTRWRKKVINLVLDHDPQSILDIATGTGDLAISFAQHTQTAEIVGLDLSEGMLSIARKKVDGGPLKDRIEFVKGDSEALPFPDNRFHAITVSFGIRNFEDLEKGLSEIFRVLAPGGIFVILETAVPTRFPWKQGYHAYSRAVLPLVGKLFARDNKAYGYLSESASVFPHGEALNNILRKIGFKEVIDRPQTFGVASIYRATK
jgi:demethylmenaquinone methyltransferase/2-methoxy-6-polyprenyl-1,4-benzoquinol methylase